MLFSAQNGLSAEPQLLQRGLMKTLLTSRKNALERGVT